MTDVATTKNDLIDNWNFPISIFIVIKDLFKIKHVGEGKLK